MNIQIYGTNKCFDTKKAQRHFKERNIKFQFVDLAKYGMSKGEYQSIKRALGCKLEDLVNEKSKKYMRWPKYWSFSFNICPFNGYSGLISFRTD